MNTSQNAENSGEDAEAQGAQRGERGQAAGERWPSGEGRGTNLRRVLDETERQEILSALEQANWIVAGPHGAAELLGMKRSTLQFRMRKLGISRR